MKFKKLFFPFRKLIFNLSSHLFLFLLAANLLLLSFLAAESFRLNQINLIPQPFSIQRGKGTLNLSERSKIIISQRHHEVLEIANEFQSRLRQATSWPWEIKDTTQINSLRGHIFLRLLPTKKNLGAEGYELRINSSNILIDASTPAGLFYGLQTLWQVFPASFESFLAPSSNQQLEGQNRPFSASLSLPLIHIIDKPRFRWRGVHLDCSRHFFPKSG